MTQISRTFASIEQMTDRFLPKKSDASTHKEGETSFEEVFREKSEAQPVHFSKHANKRLALRKIDLSMEQLTRLQEGTEKAREKGIRDSLVMVDDLAFIVNTKSNTVITAMNEGEDAIFTNIDGAVIS